MTDDEGDVVVDALAAVLDDAPTFDGAEVPTRAVS
jgi:hypothetical protein